MRRFDSSIRGMVCACFFILGLVLNSNSTFGQNITEDFKLVHKKHHVEQVQGLVDFIDDRDGLMVGLVYQHGLNWDQAEDVKRYIVSEISNCWESTFITKANSKKVEVVVKAYKAGKTQFIKKKVPELESSLTSCAKQLGTHIQKRIDYIIANN